MSFVTPIQGYIPNSEFVYTTTNVNADAITCTDLTATNATFTNLVTTTFSPVNIVGTNLTCDNATINTATIDTATIDEIKLNDLSGSGDTSIIYRDANQVNFVGKSDPTESGVDYLFYHNQKSGPPRFKILRDTNSCECQNMSITAKLTTSAIDVGIIKIEDGTLFDRSSYLELVNGLFKFVGDLNTPTDISFYCKLSDGPKLTITNLGIQTPGLVDAATLKADISQNLIAGAGITLNTSGGLTTITNSAQVEDPLTINTLNSTTINNSGTITTNNLSSSTITGGTITGNIGGNLIAGAGVTLNTSGGLTTITNSAQVEDPLTINTLNSTTINNSGTITTNNLSSSTITGGTITGNIGGNLIAGEGIDISTLSGLTTITNTGGLSTSTQYAFQITSNSFNNVSYSAGGVLNFNQIVFCTPSIADYNTTNKNYVVQVQGYYQFGFKLYLNSSTTTVARFGIYKNGSLLGMGGAYLANAETITVVALCNVGDLINVKCEVGTNISVYMAPAHSWFYGYLLQPKNNTIDTTTNLTINNLTAAGSITADDANILAITSPLISSDVITSTTSISTVTAYISTANITDGDITNLNANNVLSNTTNTTNIITEDANISDLTCSAANISDLTCSTANITNLTCSTLNYTPKMFYATYSATSALANTILVLNPGTISINNSYGYTNGVITVPDSGFYRISAQINYQNNTTLRMCGELAGLINGTELQAYPKGYSYARGANEGRFASSGFQDWLIELTAGNNIRFFFTVALGTSTTFNGTLTGITLLTGTYISITKIS